MDEYDPKNQALVAHNAGNSFALFLTIIHEETSNMRRYIRRFGAGIREFINLHFSRRDVYKDSLIKLAVKAAPVDFDFDNTLLDHSYLSPFYSIPQRTFADTAFILLNNEEDGVHARLAAFNPVWQKLPEYTPLISKEAESPEFQLWDRTIGSPCTMVDDDDEDRLSLPSTRTTDWGRDKMDTVEAQLAFLTKQMNHLLQLQKQQATGVVCQSRTATPCHDSSDDEGRGASLKSETSYLLNSQSIKKERDTIAVVVPPGPAPPPPPINLLKPVENKLVYKAEAKLPETQNRPVRPTVAQLQNVQLRKVSARSPGGTPQGKRNASSEDLSNILACALRERFKNVNTSFSDQEEQNMNKDNSWIEEE